MISINNRTDQNDKQLIEQRIKVLILGNSGAGKGDVAKGADVCVPFKSLGVSLGKKINLDENINYKLTMVFWTLTKGRPRTDTYFSGAAAAIIVGNLKSRGLIKQMSNWADMVLDSTGNIPLYFVGIKNSNSINTNIPLLERKSKSRNFKFYSKLKYLAEKYDGHFFTIDPKKENSLKSVFRTIGNELALHYYGDIQLN